MFFSLYILDILLCLDAYRLTKSLLMENITNDSGYSFDDIVPVFSTAAEIASISSASCFPQANHLQICVDFNCLRCVTI